MWFCEFCIPGVRQLLGAITRGCGGCFRRERAVGVCCVCASLQAGPHRERELVSPLYASAAKLCNAPYIGSITWLPGGLAERNTSSSKFHSAQTAFLRRSRCNIDRHARTTWEAARKENRAPAIKEASQVPADPAPSKFDKFSTPEENQFRWDAIIWLATKLWLFSHCWGVIEKKRFLNC